MYFSSLLSKWFFSPHQKRIKENVQAIYSVAENYKHLVFLKRWQLLSRPEAF